MTTPQSHFATPELLRYEQSPPLLIAGMRERAVKEPGKQIPLLWQRFAPHIGKVPHQIGAVTYGICLQSETDTAGFDYVAGCAVSDTQGLPADWARVQLPAQRYAVFAHRGPATHLNETIAAIFDVWLPGSGCAAVRAGNAAVGFFERYGPGFDPNTNSGDIEVWLPVAS